MFLLVCECWEDSNEVDGDLVSAPRRSPGQNLDFEVAKMVEKVPCMGAYIADSETWGWCWA